MFGARFSLAIHEVLAQKSRNHESGTIGILAQISTFELGCLIALDAASFQMLTVGRGDCEKAAKSERKARILSSIT